VRAITLGVLRVADLYRAEKAEITVWTAIWQHKLADTKLNKIFASRAREFSTAALRAAVPIARQCKHKNFVPYLTPPFGNALRINRRFPLG
jgi:hypothetical protein